MIIETEVGQSQVLATVPPKIVGGSGSLARALVEEKNTVASRVVCTALRV
jgi:kynurenine formamidase